MRKGIEQPQLIVYVLFTIVLTLSGIYVAFTYLGGVHINFEFHDYASRLNLVTSKMIYSADCFGVESTYSMDGTHYQKEIGVVNWTKFNTTKTIPLSCIAGGENQTWVRLKFLDSNIEDTVWSCAAVTSCTQLCEDARQTCYKACLLGGSVCMNGCDAVADGCLSLCVNCKEPDDETLRVQWQGSARNMLVFIQNGTSLELGALQVRLKG